MSKYGIPQMCFWHTPLEAATHALCMGMHLQGGGGGEGEGRGRGGEGGGEGLVHYDTGPTIYVHTHIA